MVITDFKLRYQGSFLGYFWSLLKPLMLFTILYLVFVRVLRFGAEIPYYPVYLLLGLVIWGFFVEATSNGMSAIVGRGDLLRKLNFPRYTVVLSAVLSAMVNLLFNGLVVLVFILILRVPLRVEVLWLPLLLVELLALSVALAFILSALFVRFRDLNYFWEVGLQAAFYATPIIYPLAMVPHRWAKLMILSPVAQLLQDARHALISPTTDTIGNLYGSAWMRLVPLGFTALLGVASIVYFKRKASTFAEEI